MAQAEIRQAYLLALMAARQKDEQLAAQYMDQRLPWYRAHLVRAYECQLDTETAAAFVRDDEFVMRTRIDEFLAQA
jgi:hypothetical protein